MNEQDMLNRLGRRDPASNVNELEFKLSSRGKGFSVLGPITKDDILAMREDFETALFKAAVDYDFNKLIMWPGLVDENSDHVEGNNIWWRLESLPEFNNRFISEETDFQKIYEMAYLMNYAGDSWGGRWDKGTAMIERLSEQRPPMNPWWTFDATGKPTSHGPDSFVVMREGPLDKHYGPAGSHIMAEVWNATKRAEDLMLDRGKLASMGMTVHDVNPPLEGIKAGINAWEEATELMLKANINAHIDRWNIGKRTRDLIERL